MRLLLLILALFPIVTHAENWVAYGSFGPVTYYMDKDSAKRNGDLATIMTRKIGATGTWNQLYSFDCKRQVWITPSLGSFNISDFPEEKLLFDASCKKFFEFWK
jgi:hypothetical protein